MGVNSAPAYSNSLFVACIATFWSVGLLRHMLSFVYIFCVFMRPRHATFGQRYATFGQWPTTSGRRPATLGHRDATFGHRDATFGHRDATFGHWPCFPSFCLLESLRQVQFWRRFHHHLWLLLNGRPTESKLRRKRLSSESIIMRTPEPRY